MAYYHSYLIGPSFSPVPCEKPLLINRPVMMSAAKKGALSLQVTREEEQKLQVPNASSLSRRDAMLYMTTEVLSGFALLSTEPAEARVGKLERKRKIMEKLEKLREKAGVSKPNTENGSEKTIPLIPNFPLPPQSMNPQRKSIGPLVEATLP